MVSRLLYITNRHLKLAFATDPSLKLLPWLYIVTRRFIMQKARCHPTKEAPTACKQTGSGSISILYARYFSPFLHSTRSLSVSKEYLALGDGPPRFTQDFTCPALLRILLAKPSLQIRDYHPLWWSFPTRFFSLPPVTHCSPTTPHLPKQKWFGLVPVRSPLLRESLFCSLLLRVLRCFSSPRLLLHCR